VLQFIEDSLKSVEILYELEEHDENQDTFVICALDKHGYENRGIIGWSEDKGCVSYAAFDPLRAAHDEAEGVEERYSTCWWVPESAEQMCWHLTGRVRQMTHEDFRNQGLTSRVKRV